jgi:hypothetical protein
MSLLAFQVEVNVVEKAECLWKDMFGGNQPPDDKFLQFQVPQPILGTKLTTKYINISMVIVLYRVG